MGRGRAKIVVQQVVPQEVPVPERPGEMDERDVDERFASIIARWDGPVPAADDATDSTDDPTPAPRSRVDAGEGTPTAPGSASETDEQTSTEDAARPERDAGPAAPGRPGWVNPSPLDIVVPASSWRSAEPADDETKAAAAAAEAALEEEHYEPPQVTLPRRRTSTSGAR